MVMNRDKKRITKSDNRLGDSILFPLNEKSD